MTDDVARPTLGPLMRSATLSDQAAEEITKQIASGRLSAGARLPAERELAEQLGVSRTVVREAIRTLSARGLLSPVGGAGVSVALQDGHAVRDAIGLLLRVSDDIDRNDVLQVRRVLEIEIAGLAAEHSGPEDHAALDALCDKFTEARDSPERAALIDVEFHHALSLATGNMLWSVILESIAEHLLGGRLDILSVPGQLERTDDQHRFIALCVRNHDAEGARSSMRRHIAGVENIWFRNSDTNDG